MRSPTWTAHATLLQSLLRTAYTVFLSTRQFLFRGEIDRFYVFNSRFVSSRGVLRACQARGVECLVHERGCDLKHYQLFPNTFPHDRSFADREIRRLWNGAADDPERAEKGARWYRDKASGGDTYQHSYVLGQEQGRLPTEWDPSRRNVVIFTSSEDEFVGIGDEWRNPLYPSELSGVQAIVRTLSEEDHDLRCSFGFTPISLASRTGRREDYAR